MPLTYRLDDLGWFEFERIIQALLKAQLGLGVEAWGGSGDLGREAYFEGQLRYPIIDLTDGRFVFQCKFVEGANAAGAKVDDLILNAVRKERTAIKKRLENGAWKVEPTHYGLFTNAPLAPALRYLIKTTFEEALPTAKIFQHDGEDICAWLRLAPTLIRTCPQLLTIRDLHVLLTDIVNATTLSRSDAAIEMAKEHSKVFVPTEAYREALAKLERHYFVILEGPPEMGKTTIGRVIALAQLCSVWDAIEVRKPAEVLASFDRNRKQVFVADDFFGRTEYEPTLASAWRAELAFILPKLDSSHWLVLTTRAHLLNLAKPTLDVAGQNQKFPALGEVVVDAGNLTKGEKALILYRHAKVANLSPGHKAMIKRQARGIVENRHYTPERIRRYVQELLPQFKPGTSPEDPELERQTKQALNDPTIQMRASFRSLGEHHKWLLWSLLDADSRATKVEALRESYERLCPADALRDFDSVLVELTQAFVRNEPRGGVVWAHPSCRDLAIDELATTPLAREGFLRRASETGLLLALSIGGGSKGERTLPLLRTDRDWESFAARGIELVKLESMTAARIWSSRLTLIERGPKTSETADASDRLKHLLSPAG